MPPAMSRKEKVFFKQFYALFNATCGKREFQALVEVIVINLLLVLETLIFRVIINLSHN